jgi:hypothetical protein
MWLAVALLVAGFGIAFAPVVGRLGLCAFVPCDPGPPPVLGWSQGPDGRATLEVGPVSGPETTTVELRTADDAHGASKVLWLITRKPGNSPSWDGTVTLGDTPAGFTQATPLTVPVPAGAQVQASNGCYFGRGTVPRTLPARGIAAEGGVMTRQEFAGEDHGYSSCLSDAGPRANVWGWVVMAAGAVLLVWRAWSVRRRPQAA